MARSKYSRGRTYRKGSRRPTSKWRKYAGKALTHLGASAVKTLKNKLGLNTENLYVDINSTTTLTTSLAMQISPHEGITQGDTSSTRSGRSIRLTHWTYRGHIYHNVSNTAGSQHRCIITYQPMSPATTVLGASAVLQSQTNINSPYAINLAGLKILFDKTFVTSSATNPIQKFKFKYSPLQHHIRWTSADTTGVLANVEEGAVQVFWFSNEVGVNYSTIYSYSRMYYVDN